MKIRIDKVKGVMYPVIFGIIIFILWQCKALNHLFNVSEQILPSPTHICEIISDNIVKMIPHIKNTMIEILVGLLIGSVLGYLLAVLAALFPIAGKGGISLVTAFNAVPIIALTPVLLNISKLISKDVEVRSMIAKISVIAVVTMASMSITAYRGLTETKPFAEDLLQSYACKKRTILWKLRIPNSIPYIFTSLKIGIPTSVISALVSEYFTESSTGVGYQIRSNVTLMQYPTAWGYIFVACLIGIIMYAILMIVQVIFKKLHRA